MCIITGTAAIAQNAGEAPEARYVMDAGTIGGFMGQPNSHELTLRLGSRLPASGAPKADHFMPQGARLGASVPLETPVRTSGEDYSGQFQRPKGRLLLYWGCGERAGPGQPIVVDFAKLAKGQVPPNLFSAKVPMEAGPMPENSRTYGTWPNGKSGKAISPQSSILGQHRIAGNYSPEIAFGLDQDFMGGMKVRASDGAMGSTVLNWSSLNNATGYYAWAMGGQDMGGSSGAGRNGGGDMVWWSSSATQEFGGGLWNWLSPGIVSKLIAQKVVMPTTQTSCTVPAEVKKIAGEHMMGFVYAYGPEANFAFPARPADPKTPWKPKWTAKVRYRSMANFMTGMPDMSQMGDRDERDDSEDRPNRPQTRPKGCKPSLGGILRGAIGAGGC
ncbi:MAG: hypothetical protein EOP62_01710 [Sphingomonadales bacterium]|nr:MAG: hypothetical protein EOP62_01710 [Sphingomonadales bacterium]